jgi:hypothetical protein
MLGDLDWGGEISRLTERLPQEAGAAGRFPKPVDDIIAAPSLEEPSDSRSIRRSLRALRATSARRSS